MEDVQLYSPGEELTKERFIWRFHAIEADYGTLDFSGAKLLELVRHITLIIQDGRCLAVLSGRRIDQKRDFPFGE